MRTTSLLIFGGLLSLACSDPPSSKIPEKSFQPLQTSSSPDISCANPFAGARTLAFKSSGWTTDFCKHTIDYNEIRSGGPLRDGIPPIDTPKFVPVASASRWIHDAEPVISLRVGDEVRAYPLQILIWHEIVNDVIGSTPVVVSFCPLCYAALVFERPLHDGVVLSFGTSGNLRNSDLIMWDRQTESWWQQFTGEAIVGSLVGTKLAMLPSSIVSWKSFKTAHPRATVLSRDTGSPRPYGRNPYLGYDDISKKPFLFQGEVGLGLPPMAHVVGVQQGSQARAYPLARLRSNKLIEDTLGGRAVVLFYKAGTVSALDTKNISNGSDIGSTGVFSAVLDGKRLHFSPLAGASAFVDLESGSHWSPQGAATSGPYRGKQLRALPHHQVFWFAWSAFVVDNNSIYSD